MIRRLGIIYYLIVLLAVLIIVVLSGCAARSGQLTNESVFNGVQSAEIDNTVQHDEAVPGTEYIGPVYIDDVCLKTKCQYGIEEFDSRVKTMLKVYSDPGFEGYVPNLQISQDFNVYCANGTSDYRYIYFVFSNDECISIADIYYNYETSSFSEVYSDFMDPDNKNNDLQAVTDCYKNGTEFYLYNYNQFQIYLVTSESSFLIDGIEWDRALELINPSEPEKQAIQLN